MQHELFPAAEKDVYAELVKAEQKAAALFAHIETTGMVQPGKTEKELNAEIYALARDMFGVKKHWHKRIVRAGKNTLEPYRENPPNLVLQEDDILFFDFGPVFEQWEADFGRTYVIGHNPDKLRLAHDVKSAWHACKQWFDAQPEVTGAALYAQAVAEAQRLGWEFGANIAGHLIGKFPHEKLDPRQRDNYICAANKQSMALPDKSGKLRHWILEIHLVDREKQIGGFFEQLLV